ncbi:MAG: hypothetical protein ABH882_01040 [Candidatus Omnitrophota bacterium]|nr:hypothetical protein [Candidatus Omnitrophota bacterium]MBU1929497.1 hypothetical protein [Candidatus Omnitrophota bacterium]
MKDKKVLIFIIFILITGFIFIYISRPIHKPKLIVSKQIEGIIGLNDQVDQLKEIVHSLVQSEGILKKQLGEQKKKFADLENGFMEAVSRNEAINKELSLSRVGLDLAKPLKQKFTLIEDKLANFNFAEGKEKQIIKQLQDINKSLDAVDNQMSGLASEDKIYRVKAQSLESELSGIKQDLKQERIKRDALAREFNSMNMELKMANKAKASAGEKAADLGNEVAGLKNNNSYLSEEIKKRDRSLKEMSRRESELIREKERLVKNKQKLEDQVGRQYQVITPLKEKNKELNEELHVLKSELDQLSRERQVMLKTMDEAKVVILNYQKLQQEVSRLQTQLEEVNINYAGIKEEYNLAQESIKQGKLELGSRADRILTLQGKTADIENKLIELQLKYKEVEKESASLRQDNVALQLEKEEVALELGRTKEKLVDLDSKLQQISSVFGSGLKSAESAVKKVDVKLVPEVQIKSAGEEK